MHRICYPLLLCTAVLLLGHETAVHGTAVAEYSRCSLSVKALDDNNIGAKLTCKNGSDDEEVLKDSDPIPVGISKNVPGTPITFFGDTDHVIRVLGNTGSNSAFELYDSTVTSLPKNLQKVESVLLVQDAQLQLTNCDFNVDDISEDNGGIRSIIHRSGKGTLRLSGCKFLSAIGVEDADEPAALKGSGEGEVVVEKSTFLGMGASAIDWQGDKLDKIDIHFRDCIFRNNRGPKGGVAYLKSPLNMTMEKCTVAENITPDFGGVFNIEVEDPADLFHLQLIDTTFTGNEAGKAGSVVYLNASGSDVAENRVELEIRNCNITDNRRNTAIFVSGGGYVNASVIGGKFIGNDGLYHGGAIGLVDVDTVVLEGVTFEKNVVTGTERGDGAADNPSGGALHVVDMKSMSLSRCTFKDNLVTNTMKDTGGGAIYVKNTDDNATAVLKMRETDFSHNTAGYAGGALYIDTLSQLEMELVVMNRSNTIVGPGGGAMLKNIKRITGYRLTIENNTGRVHGGGIAIDTCEQADIGSLPPSPFTNNIVTAPPSGGAGQMSGGGALSVFSKTPCALYIYNVQFEGSSDYGDGGLLLTSGTSVCSISHSNFRQKTILRGDGGAAMMNCTESLRFRYTGFDEGGAANGGALFYTGPQIYFSGAMINNITATADGGAFYFYGLEKVEMYEVQCRSNAAGKKGGAVAILGEPEIAMGGCRFADNTAGASGGAIYIQGGKSLKMDGIWFTQNSAASGGAVSVEPIEGDAEYVIVNPLLSTFSRFEDNTATSNGGALQITGNTDVELTSSEFSGCKTEGDGACVYVAGSPTLLGDGARLNISQSTFATASAGQAGGAVFGIDLSSVSFVSSEVDGSEGGSGGCASIEGVDIVSVVDSKMHNCNALSGDGGGLWITSSRELDIKGTTFNSTQAQKKGNGGALFLNSVGSVSINESNFIFSSADGSGGGIWLSEGIAQIENCSFNHTTAREGSALAVGGNAEANLIDTNILKSRTFPLKGGVLATLSCAAKINVGGECIVDIPFKAGRKKAAKARAFIGTAPNCESSSINVSCAFDHWLTNKRKDREYPPGI